MSGLIFLDFIFLWKLAFLVLYFTNQPDRSACQAGGSAKIVIRKLSQRIRAVSYIK